MVAAASGDRPSLARATRLHLLLVAADHVRCGVDGDEAKRLLADAVDLVRRVGGHEREAAGGDPAALPLDPYLGLPGDHDDRLLGAVGVPRKAVPALERQRADSSLSSQASERSTSSKPSARTSFTGPWPPWTAPTRRDPAGNGARARAGVRAALRRCGRGHSAAPRPSRAARLWSVPCLPILKIQSSRRSSFSSSTRRTPPSTRSHARSRPT